ncbi:hypothetical protein [Anaerosporobacter faecicola]|uniref:hypothetical protein n=1 Tax=Anaerosporobacter faecicola TaxID=2718714 RepID=UPI00143A974D|nr:hypothetical protein [Anaerosporobacter faecicola]
MADGTLKFDTKVDNTGFVEGVQKMSSKQVKLQNDIKKTQAEMSKLEKSMKDMQNTKVPTQEYQDIQKQIEQAESQLNKYLATEERLKAIGGINTKSKSWKVLQYNINEARATLNAAKADMADLSASGGDFTIGGDTTKLDAMQSKYRVLSDQLELYKIKLQETNSAESMKSAKNVKSAINSKQSVDLDKTSSSSNRLNAIFNKLKITCGATANGLKKVGNVANVVSRSFGTIVRSVGKATSAVVRGGKRMLQAMNPLNGIKNMFSGMLGRMMIMSLGFMAFTKALQGIGAGMSAVIRTSPQLSANLAQIKGNLYTAFQPILEACLPALNALFSVLVKVTAALAQFLSMLFGKSVKASQAAAKSQYDQAKALDATAGSAKKAKKELKGLADFDELHNTNSTDNSSGGGGGGADGSGVTPDFTTPIDESGGVSDFVKALKEAWKASDFTEIGVIIGEKLNSALESIPWDGIQANCNKIAQCIATFINGFMSVKKLWTNIGKTIGEGINTALGFANTLVNTLDWDSLGNSLGLAFGALFDTVDWDMLANTVYVGLNGVFTAIRSFLETVDFGTIGTNIGSSIQSIFNGIDWANIGITLGTGINSITSLFNNMCTQIDFIGIGSNFAISLNNMITSINWNALGKTISNGFNLVIQSLYGFVTTFDWSSFGTSVGECINTALTNTDWVALAAGASALVTGLIDAIDGFIRSIDWGSIGTTIGEMIKTIDWIGIATKLLNLLISAVKALANLLIGLGSSLGGWIWNGIKTGLASIGAWFGKIFSGAWTSVKNAFTGVGTFFGGVRDGIKKAFSGISNWFKTTFSTAWENVKKVFSSGGKVFTGIKDGILNGLKAVINALIGGINKVIAVPFNGINAALKKIHDINILGAKPFSFIGQISVPKIPALATGTVVPANYGNFLATLGDNKKAPEVVSPIPTMKQAFKEALTEMGGSSNGSPVQVQVIIGKKTIMNEVISANSENYKAGKVSFQLA